MSLLAKFIGLILVLFFAITVSSGKFHKQPQNTVQQKTKPIEEITYKDNELKTSFYGKVPYPKEISQIDKKMMIPFYCPKQSKIIEYNKETHLIKISQEEANTLPQGKRMLYLLSQINLENFPEVSDGYFKECQMLNTGGYFGLLVLNEYTTGYKDHIIFFHPNEEKLVLSGEYIGYSQAVCEPILVTIKGNYFVQCYEGDFKKSSLIEVSAISQGFKEITKCIREDGKLVQDSRGHGYNEDKYTCSNGKVYE